MVSSLPSPIFDNTRQDFGNKDCMKKLGDIFRDEREKKQLLLRQAAALLDMDSAVLSKIERDERKATKEQLSSFSECYNLDLGNLLVQWNVERISDILREEENKPEIIKQLKNAI